MSVELSDSTHGFKYGSTVEILIERFVSLGTLIFLTKNCGSMILGKSKKICVYTSSLQREI